MRWRKSRPISIQVGNMNMYSVSVRKNGKQEAGGRVDGWRKGLKLHGLINVEYLTCIETDIIRKFSNMKLIKR